MTDDKPPPDRTKVIDLLRQVEHDIGDVRARLMQITQRVVEASALIEPLVIAHDIGSRYLWPRNRLMQGQQIRRMREELGLTRPQLSTLTGVADSTIRNIETNRHRATRPVINRVVVTLERLTAARDQQQIKEPEEP